VNPSQNNRLVVFDTETTGMNENGPVYIGHRVIEIGCVEVVDRKLTGNTFHVYINPEQQVDAEAIEVHGLTNEFLADKPRFAEIAGEFLEFIRGAELVAHNASFDTSFINHEFSLLPKPLPQVEQICSVTDSLRVARKGEYQGREIQQIPGKPLPARKNLDALCDYYVVDSSSRTYHGALLDAELLADVFLRMTGGQNKLHLGSGDGTRGGAEGIRRLPAGRAPLAVIRADASELAAHEQRLDLVEKKSDSGSCGWRN